MTHDPHWSFTMGTYLEETLRGYTFKTREEHASNDTHWGHILKKHM